MAKKRKRPGTSTPATAENDVANNNNDNGKGGGSFWKPLNVGLLAPSKAAGGQIPESADDDFESGTYNHYDNPSSSIYRSAEKELEADPVEAVGIFYGLEVLDGSQYKVVEEEGGQKRLLVTTTTTTSSDADSDDGTKKKEKMKSKGKEDGGVDSKKKKSDDLEEQTGGGDKVGSSTKKKKKKRKKKKKNNNKNDESSAGEPEEQQHGEQQQKTSSSAKEENNSELRKKKKEIQNTKPSHSETSSSEKKSTKKANKDKESNSVGKAKEDEGIADDNPDIFALQTSWLTATGGVTLRERLCKSLLSQQFWTPTPIQAATLPAAILGRRNIVGAAPTGSGKTLAYLLPIFDFLLQRNIDDIERKIHALILAPTRELALQVQRECNKLIHGKCGTLVGGMATQKQERVLNKNKPPIIIATPGRLWEMMHSRDYEHLNDLSYLRFLVIDEADRMVQQGSFPQLHSILDMVEKANPMESDDEEEDEDLHEGLDDDDDPGRLLSLPGVKGEAKVVMLDDNLLAHLEQQKNGGTLPPPEKAELDDDEFEEMYKEKEAELEEDIDEDEISLPERAPVQRQTFVYSATMTLPPSAAFIASQNKKRKRFKLKGVEGAIEEILIKARAKGQTKLVDLSNSKKQAKFNERIIETKERSKDKPNSAKQDAPVVHKRAFNLPPGLKLQEIKCTQMHKDSHLYAYLVTTRQGASGPCLVFCNSIAGVRRVGNTLKELGLPVRILHAQMQQRSRFKSVESLQDIDSRAVVVATDVAARGLDIPSVATVVHYDVARKVDDFVHRAGRTARGMGDGAVGSSMSLISPAEDKAHKKIVSELGVTFEQVNLDGRLLTSAQERANMASKIVAAEEIESKARKKNQWFREKAEEAGLEVDEENLDDGLAGGNQREQQQLREAQRSKGILRKLLGEPMVTQRYGKFLSHNSAAKQQEVIPYVVPEQANRPKKKRKKSTKS